jgi:hypothetical protein
MKMKSKLYSTLLISLIIFGCQKEDDLDRLAELSFDRPAAIGGRTLAGYQDGALYVKGQENSAPSLIFKQVEAYGGTSFNVNKMSASGTVGVGINPKLWVSVFQTKSSLGMRTDCKGEVSLGPVKELYPTTDLTDFDNSSTSVNKQNQCIPFAKMKDLNDPNFGLSYNNGNNFPYYHRKAENPGTSTMLSELIDYNPSFLVAWLGMEDVYSYALDGGYGEPIPSSADFKTTLDSVLSILHANGTKGVLANIPSLEDLPYFNLIPYNNANLTQDQAEQLTDFYAAAGASHVNFTEGPNGFVMEDPNAPSGVRQIVQGEYLTLTVPLDSMRCFLYGIQGAYIKDRYVLSLTEVSEVNHAIITYNQVITELAEKYDFALFDANSFYKNVDSGIKWNGADYSFEFVSGGFIGMDGVYPNQKGHELIANEMIRAINQKYSSAIPNVNCSTCDGSLFPE